MKEFEAAYSPWIPSIGRIDVANSMFMVDYLGTGWLIDKDVVVTNRHVAELIAARDGGRFVFRPGRNGLKLGVSVDFKHEMDGTSQAAFEVDRVIWIETNPNKADIAFLQLKPSGSDRKPVQLAETDASPSTDVVVVGYPGKASPKAIPDQELMEKIYNGRYDIKRIAPGLLGNLSQDSWSTHDCTTLGGKSGAPVLNMKTGEAVALHFAGAFLIENYAVPISVVKRYLTEKPWLGTTERAPVPPQRGGAAAVVQHSPQVQLAMRPDGAGGSVNVTIPLQLSISLGQPILGGGRDGRPAAKAVRRGLSDAVAAARTRLEGVPGFVTARRGYVFVDGEITDQRCVVVAAEAGAIEGVRAAIGDSVEGWPVDVRSPGPEDFSEAALGPDLIDLEATGTGIAYNDEDRTAPKFSLDKLEDAEMEVLCHVGPERSWEELKAFLDDDGYETLVAAMYEFNAKHIADTVSNAMERNVDVELSLDSMLANAEADTGEFSQAATFRSWERRFGNRFTFEYVPEGNGGLIWQSYHIKVAVRDSSSFWLSSGNWKPSSQPNLTGSNTTGALPGNREWHVIVKEPKTNAVLTRPFKAHIKADMEFSRDHAEEEGIVPAPVMVDVPIAALEARLQEAHATRPLLPSKKVSGKMNVRPLLTPDHKGADYCKPVLELIRSARDQLWFQIPYITPHPENAPKFLKQLVAALVEASTTVDDFRLILRSDTRSSLKQSLEALKDAQLKIKGHVKQRPNTHTKGMVVDGRHTLIGSHNWSGAGVTINRDASLIFYDNEEIAGYFAKAFEIDWDFGTDLRVPEGVDLDVRLATGDAPPPGYRRMPLQAYLDY